MLIILFNISVTAETFYRVHKYVVIYKQTKLLENRMTEAEIFPFKGNQSLYIQEIWSKVYGL